MNILSLYHTTRNYRVVFDSEDDNYSSMMFPGREVVFKVSTDFIYYHNTVYRAIVIITTVADNRKGFTRQEYEGPKAARRAPGLVRYPSKRDFTNMVSFNMIVDFPITPIDIKILTRSSAPTSPP